MGNEAGPRQILVVAAALTDGSGRFLVQKRPKGKSMAGLWEFPGGKIEPDEAPERALSRELHEELGISVREADLTPACFASEPLRDRHLVLLLYSCAQWSGDPEPHHAEEVRWVSLDEMRSLPMPPADKPLLERLDALTRPAPNP